MFEVLLYFLLFIIYSFLGWALEITFVYIQNKRFIDRGFLIGPYCPIYGISGLIIVLLLNQCINKPIILFIVIVVIVSLIEYVTSYLMEKLFRARWWDYSHKNFNINGRICLKNSILFGFLGLIFIYIVHPLLFDGLSFTNKNILVTITLIILILFIVDIIISFNVIKKLELTSAIIRKDYTEEIAEKVNEILREKSRLSNRLVNAFPNLKAINIKTKNKE